MVRIACFSGGKFNHVISKWMQKKCSLNQALQFAPSGKPLINVKYNSKKMFKQMFNLLDLPQLPCTVKPDPLGHEILTSPLLWLRSTAITSPSTSKEKDPFSKRCSKLFLNSLNVSSKVTKGKSWYSYKHDCGLTWVMVLECKEHHVLTCALSINVFLPKNTLIQNVFFFFKYCITTWLIYMIRWIHLFVPIFLHQYFVPFCTVKRYLKPDIITCPHF